MCLLLYLAENFLDDFFNSDVLLLRFLGRFVNFVHGGNTRDHFPKSIALMCCHTCSYVFFSVSRRRFTCEHLLSQSAINNH